jgi:2-keto-4-pentenoate hydratase/2-oxohepta-3-ene-1,7-dioic acid hydratase in catechol pathway
MAYISLEGENIRVGSIYGLWKTYPKHASEMRKLEKKEKAPVVFSDDPVVFSKPAASLIHSGQSIRIPRVNEKAISQNLQFEVELVLLVGKAASDINIPEVLSCISGYGVGLDMTLRDVQTEAKKNGLPWLVGKGFKTSAVVSDFVRFSRHDPTRLTLELLKNGIQKQYAKVSEMAYSLDFLISYLSKLFDLEPGDLIFTGTPEGSAQCCSSDVLEAALYVNQTEESLTNKHVALCQLKTQVS